MENTGLTPPHYRLSLTEAEEKPMLFMRNAIGQLFRESSTFRTGRTGRMERRPCLDCRSGSRSSLEMSRKFGGGSEKFPEIA